VRQKALLSGVFLLLCFAAITSAAETKRLGSASGREFSKPAKKEGSLSLYLFQGEGELAAVAQLFQKKYPEINVVTTTGRGKHPRAAHHGRAARR